MESGETVAPNMLAKLKKQDIREPNIPDTDFIKNSPKGDYTYDTNVCQSSSDCSSTDFQDEIQLNALYQKNLELIKKMDEEMDQTAKEVNEIETKVDAVQEDILNRRDVLKQYFKFKREQVKVTVDYAEKNEKIEFMIKNLEDKINSREFFINNYLRSDGM